MVQQRLEGSSGSSDWRAVVGWGVALVAMGLWLLAGWPGGVKVRASGDGPAAGAAVALTTSASPPPADERIIVQVQPSTTVDTEWVELGQITSAGTPSYLARVQVARVPLPGQTIQIPAGFLAVKLRQAGIDLDRLELVLPATGWIIITRSDRTAAAAGALPELSGGGPTLAQTGPSSSGSADESSQAASSAATLVGELRAKLSAAVESALRQFVAAGDPSTCRLHVELQQVAGLDELARRLVERAIPVSSLSWDLGAWRPQAGAFVLFARLTGSGTGSGAGAQLGAVTVYGQWQAERYVPVAAGALPAGRVLTGAEVQWRWVSLTPGQTVGGGDDWVRDPQALAGATLRLPVAAGEPVRAAWLRWPVPFPRGTSLVGYVQRGQVRLEVGLTAAEDGEIGRSFLALNPATGQLLRVLADRAGSVVAILGPADTARAASARVGG